MPEVLSGSCHGEGEGPIPRAKKERDLCRVQSPGFPGRETLRTSPDATSRVPEEGACEEAAESVEVYRLRDLWNQGQEDYANQVLSSLLGGSE